MSQPRRLLRLWALVLAGLLAVLAGGGTFAAFSSAAEETGNRVSTAADFAAPEVSGAVLAKTPGYDTGFVKQGGSFYVYANVAADTGNPASGTASVTATLPTGTIPLAAGSYSVGGSSYNYRSGLQTAPNPAGEQTFDFTVTATDNASNSSTFTASGAVDNTPPSAADVQTANGGSIAGRPEQNDTVTFTYSEPIDPQSILAGWNGSAQDVVVRVNDVKSNDTLQVFNAANSAQLPLGTVDLGRSDYVKANRTFGASGTPARMTRSGNSITVVLGTESGAGTTAGGNGAMLWTPSTAAYDRAGNASLSTTASESGPADKEF
jgi:predicted ribosomally synthesized peptide with SipW-like signal peptide